jgi:hypothetical protein
MFVSSAGDERHGHFILQVLVLSRSEKHCATIRTKQKVES